MDWLGDFERDGVVVVPQDALVRVEEGYVVFAAVEWEQGMVAEVRPVTVGATQRDMVVIEEGIESGERLIVVGQKSVADGDRVIVYLDEKRSVVEGRARMRLIPQSDSKKGAASQ